MEQEIWKEKMKTKEPFFFFLSFVLFFFWFALIFHFYLYIQIQYHDNIKYFIKSICKRNKRGTRIMMIILVFFLPVSFWSNIKICFHLS